MTMQRAKTPTDEREPKAPPSRVPFVDLAAQHDRIGAELREAIDGVLQRSDFILGEDVPDFEQEFAQYCGVTHGIGVDSGTSALSLALEAGGIGPGDEVITAANTFIASALAISHVGARPVLVDIDPGSYALDPARIEEAITSRTRAIMPVHLYGNPADMTPILEVASRRDLLVVEDASQAHGARYGTDRVGTLGHVAAFSLYPAKNLGALGDAGIVVTNDDAIAEQVRLLRNYGSLEKYHHFIQGYNRRLDTVQAAVLRVKLRRLDEWNSARRAHAGMYDELLAEEAPWVTRPKSTPGAEAVYHVYVIRAPHRDALQRHLEAAGISTVIHYPIPIHLQQAYADLGYSKGEFPITEAAADEILSLPLYPEMQRDAIEYVCETVERFHDGSLGPS